MLKWAAIMAIVALVLGVLGFGELAGAFIEIAMVLFWIALVIAVALAILGYFAYRKIT